MRRSNKTQPSMTAASVLAIVILVLLAGFLYLRGDLKLEDLLGTSPGSDAPTTGQPGAFDFYVLALSWSPQYCATDGTSDTQQCSIGRRLGFVLHGLWPQYNRGYPSDCSTAKLPPDVKARFPGLYPSPALYDHEWEKHGTCSGLAPEQYLALSRTFKDAVAIPVAYRAPEQPVRATTMDVKKSFAAANSWLGEGSLAVYCDNTGRYLKELYVCLFADGKPATCSSEIQSKAARSCQQASFLLRNVR